MPARELRRFAASRLCGQFDPEIHATGRFGPPRSRGEMPLDRGEGGIQALAASSQHVALMLGQAAGLREVQEYGL